jgi:hypothetical protein
MRWSGVLGVASLGFILYCGGTSSDPGGSDPGGNNGSDNLTDLDSGASGSTSSGSNGSSGSGDNPSDSIPNPAPSSGTSSSGGKSSARDATAETKDATAPAAGGTGTSPSAQFLPAVTGTCPTIATGTQTFAGEPVQIWAGTPTAEQNGPLVLFWYETGGSSSDATFQFGQAQITAVTSQGGIVASFAKSKGTGTNTGDAVWYTDDFLTADEVVACAIKQFHIDTRRIYTTGASAGALQATWMSYARSGYIAAAATLSGGLTGLGGVYEDPAPQDPSNVPATMATHGAPGVDVVVLDFSVTSAAWEADVAKRGGFSLDCNTGGGHVSGPPQICPAIWQFFEDHPFKVKPEPYTGTLPSVFPSYCKIGPRLADGGAP